jgi:hypothetical protein
LFDPLDSNIDNDQYEEWIYIDNGFELIGTTGIALDDYYTKTETDGLIQVAKTIHYYPNTKNTSSSQIPKGSNVKFVSATGDVINIAQATGTDVANNPEIFMGVAANNIPANQEEPSSEDVVWFGEITGVNLSTFSTGDILYFNTANGGFTTSAPTTNKIIVAAVVKGGNGGVLLVRPKWVSRDIAEVDGLTDALAGKEPANANIQSHISSTSNPHSVTKTQVGLSNVDNTSDLGKPISTATQTALNGKVNKSGDTMTGDLTAPNLNATTSVTTPSVVATSTVKIGAWVLSQNGTSGSLDFVIG